MLEHLIPAWIRNLLDRIGEQAVELEQSGKLRDATIQDLRIILAELEAGGAIEAGPALETAVFVLLQNDRFHAMLEKVVGS